MNSEFFGRLHPLLVHFPIGILILGFVLEVLSFFRRFRKVRGAVPVTIFIGVVSSALSVVTGLLLSDEGGHEPDLLFRHRLFAFMTLGFSVMLLVIINYGKYLPKTRRKPARLVVFITLMAILTITGNFGGALTHGRGYLNTGNEESQDSVQSAVNSQNLTSRILVYDHVIAPIFQEKCTGCHGQKKQKGKLRLDSKAAILKGGSGGFLLMEGNKPGVLLNRIRLNVDHEDHMPPVEKPQLTGLEIDLISAWVLSGASFEQTIEENNSPAFEKWLEKKSVPGAVSRWPDEPVEKPSEKAISSLKNDFGVIIRPLSISSNYLEIKIPALIRHSPEFWKSYKEIAPNLVTLNLSDAVLDRKLLADYCVALQLRKIYLNGAELRQDALKSLQGLNHLRYLNLVSTKISKQDLEDISSLVSLEEFYIFGHSIAAADLRNFITSHPKIRIDTGNYRLPRLATDTLVFKP